MAKPPGNVGRGDMLADILKAGPGHVQHGAGQAGGDWTENSNLPNSCSTRKERTMLVM